MRSLCARGLLRRRRPSRASRCRAVDFFGLPHGRPVGVRTRRCTAVQEGRGFNSYVPDAVRRARARRVRQRSARGRSILYYQIDYTLAARARPTTLGLPARDVPAREPDDAAPRLRDRRRAARARAGSSAATSACASIDAADWYGEGEVKVYRDGDDELPTICGTGLEDYVGSAWGMGAHTRPTAARRSSHRLGQRGARAARLRRLLPLARARPDHVRDRPAGHDPADRREVLRRRAGGRARGVRAHATRSRARAGIRDVEAGDASRGASPSASTTTARRPTCTAASRKRCRASTSPPRSPTSNAARGRPPTRWRPSPP